MRLAPINQAQPVNWSHPLNQGRLAWYLALPHVVGGSYFYDLISDRPLQAVNGPAWSPTSRPGGSMHVTHDGSTSYHTGPDAGFPTGGNQRSMSLWFRVSGTTTTYRNMVGYGKAGTVNQASGLLIAPSNDFFTTQRNKLAFSQWGASYYSASVVTDNAWRHGVFTYDGTTPHIYINGINNDGGTNGTLTISTVLNSLELGRDSSPGNWSDASVDDVSIYSRALSASEVLDLYNESLAGYPTMLNRLDSPITRFAPQGGPFPWYLDSSAMSGGLQTMGL